MVIVISSGCETSKVYQDLSIDEANKILLHKNGNEEMFYWELDDEKNLWEFELGHITALKLYRDSIKFELGDNKYKSAIQKESVQNLEKSLIENEENGDRINALLVHSGAVGEIRRINYLESQILNYQIGRFPLFSRPTEFHGFIAENEKEGKIKVYFGSSDTEWPPKPTIIIQEIDKELKRGWKLKYHLHNHYCKKDRDYIGILAPSLADAQYYKMLKERFNIEKSLITNGFHTVEIDNQDFAKFESH